MPHDERTIESRLLARGVSRRDFMKFCAIVAGTLALPATSAPKVAEALQEAAKRPPVVWLEFQDCAADTESFLRAENPTAAAVLLEIISLDYHETVMAAAGHQAEENLRNTIDAGGHIVVVEGSIPLAEDGIYCCIAGRTAIDILQDATRNAAAVIAVGSCSSFGGLPKVTPNPTNAVSVMDLVDHIPIVNLSGCPMNVVNFTATIVHYLTFGGFPALDNLNRPIFAHGQIIHDNCERRGHFSAGEFVKAWGDEGHRLGWCLYEMGCKGPVATFNCPSVRWNGGTNWPVRAGHGCIACAAPDFFERAAYEPVALNTVNPPDFYPTVDPPPEPISAAGAATLGAVGGLLVGAGATAAVAASRSRKQATVEPAEEPAEAEA